MRIRTKVALASGGALAAIGLVAAVIAWAHLEVGAAGRERERTGEITRGLTDLRLMTFEYLLHREERPRLQWHAVSSRLDRAIAASAPAGAAEAEILAGLRARRARAPRLFAELTDGEAALGPQAARSVQDQRFEAQLLSRLLILQQESLADAFRLDALAAARIERAQQREAWFGIAGLALVAAIVSAAFLLFRRDVLVPVMRLEAATRAIAAGDWDAKLGAARDDEIGAMTRNFDAMVHAMREAFVRAEGRNRELADLNRELEAFSYSVSHDLRAPLRAMDGFSLALSEDCHDKLDAEGKDALARIRAASQRMGKLIDDLLSLSRVTRAGLSLADVDLSAAAREIADSLQQSQPGRTVRWEIAEGLRLHADPALVRIALANLMDNAWKFTGKAAAPEIRVGALEEKGVRTFFVADNGAGFDPAHAERLFGAFQRLHHVEDFPGTGIGLAIVSRIVRRHGGRIRAEAQPGAGAAFFFTVGHTEDASHG